MMGCACGHFCRCAPRTVACLDCGGKGWNYCWTFCGTQAVACANCGGSGRIPVRPAFPPRAPGYPVPHRSVPMYRLQPLRF
jgi:hypothetical protein